MSLQHLNGHALEELQQINTYRAHSELAQLMREESRAVLSFSTQILKNMCLRETDSGPFGFGQTFKLRILTQGGMIHEVEFNKYYLRANETIKVRQLALGSINQEILSNSGVKLTGFEWI
jgi:hypothetical protein